MCCCGSTKGFRKDFISRKVDCFNKIIKILKNTHQDTTSYQKPAINRIPQGVNVYFTERPTEAYYTPNSAAKGGYSSGGSSGPSFVDPVSTDLICNSYACQSLSKTA